MSVIIMGDQAVGKTTLILELAKSNRGNVQVIKPSYKDLEKFTIGGQVKPTDSINSITMQLRVNLSGNIKDVKVDWIDTPGEAWRAEDSRWRKANPADWNLLSTNLRSAKFLMIVMAPYRELLNENLVRNDGLNMEDIRFRKQTQWKNRFQEWINFLENNAKNNQYVVFCLNMADLFCNVQQISDALQQEKSINWMQHKIDVLPIFDNVRDLINRFEKNRILKTQVFITTYKIRPLLELPWLYIGT
ncbi:MAG: hypothetical protein AB4372_21170 [Xenococcus sp. (in: cyanobacteria)]